MKKDNVQKIMSYEFSPEVMKKIQVWFAVLIGSFLFVWNTEAIPLSWEGELFPFIEWLETEYCLYGYVTITMLWIFCYCLSGNLFVSYVIMELITFLWGTANRITIVTRKQAIAAADLKIAKEAVGVRVDILSMIDALWMVLLVIGMIMTLVMYKVHYKGKNKSNKNREVIWKRGLVLIVVLILFVSMYTLKPTGVLLYENNAFKKTGTVVWFSQSLFSGLTENISLEDVEKIYDKFEKETKAEVISENRPNVIVIMSEAFWDLNHLRDNITLSENPMDAYEELVAEAVTGEVAVNVYGGGTVTTEFEFLTGLNALYFSDVADFYETFYTRPQGSFVSYMRELGYNTMALHPYVADFYGRDKAYENMGFEQFVAMDDFRNRTMFHGYISDGALTKEIIERFEEQKEKEPDRPVFSFSVSVQNHVIDMKYTEKSEMKYTEEPISVRINNSSLNEKQQQRWDEYVNGVQQTVLALEELIAYFETYEEETVIVFFGDHAPGIVADLTEVNGKEKEVHVYRTPYAIWTNFEIEDADYGDMNISYLSTALIDYLDFPKSKQCYVNEYLMEWYPINTRFEKKLTENAYTDEMMDIMNISYYVRNKFPEKDNALPFWNVNVVAEEKGK